MIAWACWLTEMFEISCCDPGGSVRSRATVWSIISSFITHLLVHKSWLTSLIARIDSWKLICLNELLLTLARKSFESSALIIVTGPLSNASSWSVSSNHGAYSVSLWSDSSGILWSSRWRKFTVLRFAHESMSTPRSCCWGIGRPSRNTEPLTSSHCTCNGILRASVWTVWVFLLR